MGEILVDNPDQPQSALARLGKKAWFGFLAGKPCLKLIEACRGLDIILVPVDQAWAKLIEDTYGQQAEVFDRHAMVLTKPLYPVHLAKLAQQVPPALTVKAIDEEVYQLCLANSWSRDLVANYDDYAHFQRAGLGVAILAGQHLLAGASSLASSSRAIEIEIDTHPAYRRQGLARLASAQLLLACLEQDLTPSWDAHNLASCQLAEQLGYKLAKTYTAYEINW